MSNNIFSIYVDTRPGSVVAMLQVGAANPNITEVKLSFKNMTQFGEYSVDGDNVTIRREKGKYEGCFDDYSHCI